MGVAMATSHLRNRSSHAGEGAGNGSGTPTGPEKRQLPISKGRRVWIHVLIAITTLLLVVATFSVWANRLLFNPDNWSKTSTKLLQHDEIRSTTANYLVDQLYANVDVATLIGSRLPARLAPLAQPVAGALREPAVKAVDLALTRPRVQDLWARANRAAALTFISVVNGGHGAVGVNQGAVTLNLGGVLDQAASRLGVSGSVGAKLPPSAANLTLLRSDQLKAVQNGGKAIKGLALILTILVPLLYALALVLARGQRRQTLMEVGLAIALAGLLVLLGRGVLKNGVSNALTQDASLRSTIAHVIWIMTGILGEIGGACILVGIPLVAAGWFAGPAKLARSGRAAVAPFLRDHVAASYAITLAVMVLIFVWNPIPATGTAAGMIVFTVLALLGTFILSRQTAQEFPASPSPASTPKPAELVTH
jgi:hypothetical protein